MIARIGKYTVEKELGHGGFGDVFLAFDPVIGQKVAIKQLRVGLGLDPDVVRRFQHEIRTTAGLRHKNIVTIFASDVENGNPYLVMEFLEGQTLKAIIQAQKPLTVLEKVNIMAQVAEGLAYAHSKGVIHRDVKPENIMLLPDDSVKIMDFGIALAADRQGSMTATGGIIGTPPYFSPEQLEGTKANEQTDIFSLGDVYYELLTGQHPFERFKHDWKALQMAILSFDPPAVSRLSPDCPEALSLLVHRMIAKEPEFRYGAFEELLPEIKAILSDLQHEYAVTLLRAVAALVETGDLQAALGRIREAQQLEPGNHEARLLRETITQQIQKAQVEGRVTQLLVEAEALMSERRFGEAVQSLESAARLDRSNATVQACLEEAKSKLDATMRANRLVSEARFKQQRGQLAEALERLTAALELDPDHVEALALAPHLRGVVARQECDSRRKQAIQTASDHLSAKRFSEALAAIEQIEQEQPGEAEVAQLRTRVEGARTEHARALRAERFSLGASRTREAIQVGELDRAGQMIDHLSAGFADEPAAAEVLPALREHLNAQIRAQQIATCRQEARALLQKKQYREALNLLAAALRKFGTDTGLERLQESAEDLHQAHQRSEEIAAALKEAGDMRDDGDLRGALDLVSAARNKFGDEAAFVELARQLEVELDQQRYAAGLETLLQTSRELTADGKFSEVIDRIAQAPEYSGVAEVRALLESTRASQAIEEERQVIAEALAASELLGSQGDSVAALNTVETALTRYPHDAALKQAGDRLREQIAGERHRAGVEKHRSTIRLEAEGGDWKKAETALRLAQSEFPTERAFDDLAGQVEAGLFSARLDEVVSRVREDLAANHLTDAVEQIEATRTVFAHDSRWKLLAESVAQRQAYEAALLEAERHWKEGDLSKAETLLKKLIGEGAADRRATQIIEAIQAERSEAAKRAEIAATMARVRERLARDDIQQAASELAAGRTRYPEASLWATLQAEIDARQALLRRQAEIAAAVASIRVHVKQDEIREAVSELSAARSRYPSEREWAPLEAEISARQVVLKRQAKIEAQQAAAKRQAEIELQQAAARHEAEIAVIAQSIRRCVERDDLRQAASELGAALAKYPGESVWVALEGEISARRAALQRRAEMSEIAASVRGWLERDDLQQAAAELGAARAKYSGESLWATLEGEIGARQAVLKRQAEISDIAARVRGCLERGDLQQAVAELGAARAKYSGESLWATLEGEIGARQAALKRQAEIAAIAGRIRGRLNREDLRQAASELGAARTKYPGESLWATIESEISARQVVLKRQAEIAAIAESIRGCLKRDDLHQAVNQLDAARPQYSDESLWATLEAEIGARQAALKRQAEMAAIAESIRERLKRDDLRQAARELGVARSKYPDESLWATIDGEISARQAALKRQAEMAALAERIRGCLQRDDLRQASRELAAARSKYPGESHWAKLESEISARQAALKRQAEISAIAESIRGRLKKDDVRRAASELLAARAKYPDEKLWATLEAETGARQAELDRQADISAIAESIRGCLKSDDLQQAATELGAVRAKYAGEKLWASLKGEIGAREAALKRQAEVTAIAESIRGCLKRDDFGQAESELRAARAKYPGESLWATLDTEIRARQSALQAIEQERQRREQDLQDGQRSAEELLAQGKPSEAIALLEGRFVGEPRLQELIARAHGDLERQQRETDRARLLVIEQQVDATFFSLPLNLSTSQRRKLRGLDAEAQGIAARRATDEELAGIASRIHERVASVLESPAATKPLPWKQIVVIAAVATVVVALVLLPKMSHKKVVATIPAEIHTNPPVLPPPSSAPVELSVPVPTGPNVGTLTVETNVEAPTVIIGNKRYAGIPGKSTVQLRLDAGDYKVAVQKNGYSSPAPQSAQVGKGSTVKQSFRLEPLNAMLEIRGGLPGTEVSVDGRPVGSVDPNGRFSIAVSPSVPHLVDLRLQGYLPKQQTVTPEPGGSIDLPDVTLSRDPAVEAQAKRLRDEENAWISTDKKNQAAVQRFVDSYPNAAAAVEARRVLEDLKAAAEKQRQEIAKQEEAKKAESKRISDEAEKQRIKDQQAQKQKQKEDQDKAEKAAILSTVREYETAYRNRDLDGIKKVFPRVPEKKNREFFLFIRSMQFGLSPEEPRISGNDATVRCVRSLTFTSTEGKRLSQPGVVNVTLKKVDGRWWIVALEQKTE